MMTTSPHDWVWCLFPLVAEDRETLDLVAVVRRAHEALDRVAATGDRAHLGNILHWAHQMKAAQSAAGDWPATLNARTGESLGPSRTIAPARLMLRLEDLLQSTEFTECIAMAGIIDGPVTKETTP